MYLNKTAVIYAIDSCVTQSAKREKKWVLKFLPINVEEKGGLMNWAGGGEVQCQVSIIFYSLNNALEFVNTNNISYTIISDSINPAADYGKPYSDNFRI
ncbi:hypothetical protein CAXC1_180067 [Candidatus Xenohaliotis californiensis]|uniref:Uncharacterized protein n=1 Tax=Candidatus Xenohaliotis californiensis TaxID=84677 RepID=A0ABP0ES33_9RICK|nr:hypothetical protein CAXC1_180067 [Candidatus Xenohaliotis californiensis]